MNALLSLAESLFGGGERGKETYRSWFSSRVRGFGEISNSTGEAIAAMRLEWPGYWKVDREGRHIHIRLGIRGFRKEKKKEKAGTMI